jgi:cell division septation protein DedD
MIEMAQRREKEVRELRLEGAGLFVIVAFLVAILVGAFFLGRWYEQSSGEPTDLAKLASDPLENVVNAEQLESVELEGSHFDQVGGEVKAEPQRQTITPPEKKPEPVVQREAPKQEPVPPKASAPTSAATQGGDFYVQIAALRDRSSADKVVSELKALNYPVRLFSENEGSGKLYRVRVGGYATRAEAEMATAKLKTQGHPGAFPTKVE